MKSTKLSGPALFMYGTMIVTALTAAVCFCLYYLGAVPSGIILWTGVVAFMILYHFGLRIFAGEIAKHVPVDPHRGFYRKKFFEDGLYKLLLVRKWKDKVLTFDPAAYDFKNRTLPQLATTMAKSERDHWVNEGISLVSLSFILLWGCWPAFVISAVLAMIFDGQFIVVQRYNRPIVMRIIERMQKKADVKEASPV
ncbi:MAG: hypothetical protein IKV54_07880 [Clostridia bacterium]|nr:hypothetical protein [Clostridia bacterium]